jgi:hypothetical protein
MDNSLRLILRQEVSHGKGEQVRPVTPRVCKYTQVPAVRKQAMSRRESSQDGRGSAARGPSRLGLSRAPSSRAGRSAGHATALGEAGRCSSRGGTARRVSGSGAVADRAGERIVSRPVSSFIHPAGRPISTSWMKVLRRPIESALSTLAEGRSPRRTDSSFRRASHQRSLTSS